MKTYLEWEEFARNQLGYDEDEAVTYATLRVGEDRNRELIAHKSFVSGYEEVLYNGWDE